MAQIFNRSTNTFARLTIFAALFVLAGLSWVSAMLQRSSWITGEGLTLHQPVPFSHEHHVSGLGIDCRYCHSTVEVSPFAGMPSTETCMNCHRIIWDQSPMLEPVRESYRTGRPLEWTRVNDLPDFVYFDHSIHVAKGIGCVSCHGRVDQMPLLHQAASLQMEWCLECHRDPERFVRPREEVFRLDWEPADPTSTGPDLVRAHRIRDARTLTTCSACHR